jgi:hypothetical protein
MLQRIAVRFLQCCTISKAAGRSEATVKGFDTHEPLGQQVVFANPVLNRSRTLPETQGSQASNSSQDTRFARNLALNLRPSRNWNAWLFRCCLAGIAAAIAVSLSPFGLHGWSAVGAGLLLSFVIFLAEYRLKRSSSSGRHDRRHSGSPRRSTGQRRHCPDL